MSIPVEWDCIIIGSGIIGLCTAYHLTKAGIKPLVLEQFNLPHTRGSSHGETRIIRRAHVEDYFAALSAESYDLWKTIEKDANQQLMLTTGLVLLGKGGDAVLKQAKAAMERLNSEHEWLDCEQLRDKIPIIRYPHYYEGLVDKTASIILGDRALNVLMKLVESGGGVIKDNTHVTSISPGNTITVNTKKGSFRSKKLVIATGPWSKEILADLGLNLPLKTMPGLHMYWKTTSPADFDYSVCPMIKEEIRSPEGKLLRSRLLFPQIDGKGMVKAVTRGHPPPFYCHPDERDKQSMQPMIDTVVEYIKQHFPSVETRPSIVEPCMYCVSPDKMGIIDKHPKFPNIVIGTAFSGRGFTLAPLAGKMLSEMVQNQKPQWDMSLFALNRFTSQSKL